MKGKRQSTVEPVFGTLMQFMGLRKVNTLEIKQASKVMPTTAIVYDFQKYLKFTQKLVNTQSKEVVLVGAYFLEKIRLIVGSSKATKNSKPIFQLIN
jgi:hypothetical protein